MPLTRRFRIVLPLACPARIAVRAAGLVGVVTVMGVIGVMSFWGGLLGCACGGGEPPSGTPRPQAGSEELLVADAAGRVKVAEVNGVPIYDDCVAIQAGALIRDREAAGHPALTEADLRRAALDQCIDFELLAAAAQARGYGQRPEVEEARKTESVRRLIDRAFLGKYPSPESVSHDRYERAYKRFNVLYQRPLLLDVAHVLGFAKGAKPGSEEDQAARALVVPIYEAVKDRRDLRAEELQTIAGEIAGDALAEKKLRFEELRFARTDNVAQPFVEAAFAIPEPGMVSPPVKTDFGWHVILLKQIHPAIDVSLEEAKPDLYKRWMLHELYEEWVADISQNAGITPGAIPRVTIDERALAALQAAEDASRFASAPPPSPQEPLR